MGFAREFNVMSVVNLDDLSVSLIDNVHNLFEPLAESVHCR